MKDVLGRLGSFVATASASALPAIDRELQQRHFTDSIVAAAVGMRSSDHAALGELWGPGIDADAALCAAAMRMTEIDDIHLPSCTTPSSAISPVVAMQGSASPQAHTAARDALWAGMELLVRFGTAVEGPELLYRNVWPTYLAAPLACAATASRLLGLDAERTAVALSLALTLTAGGSGRFAEAHSPRWLLHGKGVELGLFAARSAQAGFGADLTLLDGDWLEQTHGIALDPAVLTNDLGMTSIYPSLSIKPFSSAKQAIGATEAFAQLLAKGVQPTAIDSVTVHVPAIYAGMIQREARAGSRNYASVAYQIALAALHPDALYRCFGAGMPWNDAILAFMNKVCVQADESLSPHYPQRWPARVVLMAGGECFETTVIEAHGDPGRVLDRDALAHKAHRVFEPMGIVPDVWLSAAAGSLDDFASMSRLAAMIHDGIRGKSAPVQRRTDS
jgi:2-methylcitrate dehydratase PrpD